VPILSVTAFGGGIVLEGSADSQSTDELREADSYDIGARGQLVAASDVSSFQNVTDGVNALSPVYGMCIIAVPQAPRLLFVGDAIGATNIAFNPLTGASLGGTSPGATYAGGWNVSFSVFPYVDPSGKQRRVVLVCISMRAAWGPKTGGAIGLYAVIYNPGTGAFQTNPISDYDSLGTGAKGEYFQAMAAPGTHGLQLFPRGIVEYNNHAFAWGFDIKDATTGDGPNRVMFSNLGNPLKWGFDPQAAAIAGGAAETDRAFEDSDAFTIGGSGSVIRAGCVWNGKLYLGTNEGLHSIEGWGRDSFKTNGANPVSASRNVIGLNAMIEGPDRKLYGVSDGGLWVFNGSTVSPVGDNLRDYASKSIGYWDLIWTDASRTLLGFPGQTNQDLVWMLSDTETNQVWTVIPFCDAAAGYGFGADTVIIKFNTITGGFVRQVFSGKTLLHGALFKRDATATAQRFICAPGYTTNVAKYAAKATAATSPVMPTAMPTATFGEYSPHGADGTGSSRKIYLTFSWESAAALPLVFSVTPSVDGKAIGAAITLTIGPSTPGSPADGDMWIDTSGTDMNLGNGTAGAIIPASPGDYIMKRWAAGRAKWDYVPSGGQQANRVSVPIAYTPIRGSRVKVRVVCVAANGRYQIEQLGLEPSTIRSDR
jgi:hypothetical protein